MGRKVLALCLVLVMCVTMMPGTVLAATGPSLSVGTTTVNPGESGSVSVSINGNTGFDSIAFVISAAEGVSIDSVSTADGIIAGWSAQYYNGYFSAYTLASAVTDDGVICTINFTASATASGTVVVSLAEDTEAVGTLVLNNSAVADVSMVAGSVTVGTTTTDLYTAEISTTASEFTVDDTVEVTVTVGGTVGSFASSEVTLTYDSAYLTFNESASTLNGAGVDLTTTGTIKLVDHGETNAYPAAYVLNFTAKQATTGAADLVTLTDAKFSTAEKAISSDLIEATGENALSLTIKNADLDVTLPTSGVVTGDSTVPYGEDYTFTAKNNTTYMYYDYVVSATMGGTDVTVKDNGNGTWTIENVTGDLLISVTETPKTYTVTVNGDNTVTDAEIASVTTSGTNADGKATYNTALTYTLPAGQAATDTVDGYHYTASVTVGGATYNASANGLTYTIAETAVTGNIVITLSKVTDPAASVLVTIKDSNEIQKDGQTVTEFTASKNSSVTLTLVPETGYTYVINDGTNNLTINDDNTFTVAVGTSPITITVTKTLDTSSVKVQQYIQLNNTVMWLVTINGNGTTEISDKTYSYDGSNMFWSSKYQAYCYLVVASDLTVDDAKAEIGTALIGADAVDVEYNMDVNNTNGKVDANDAQLVYNMYQTKAYDGFDTVDMIKFLEADLNDTVGVDSTDAQVIINKLLNITT